MARRIVDGILLLDKPLEVSSNGILSGCAGYIRPEKPVIPVLLDPLASG